MMRKLLKEQQALYGLEKYAQKSFEMSICE